MPVTPSDLVSIILKIDDQFRKKGFADRSWRSLAKQVASLMPIFQSLQSELVEPTQIQNAMYELADVLIEVQNCLNDYQEQGLLAKILKATSNNDKADYFKQQIQVYCGLIQLGLSVRNRDSNQTLINWFGQQYDPLSPSRPVTIPKIVTKSFKDMRKQIHHPYLQQHLARFLSIESNEPIREAEEYKELIFQKEIRLKEVQEVIKQLYDSYNLLIQENSRLEADQCELHSQVSLLKAKEEKLRSSVQRVYSQQEMVQKLLITSHKVSSKSQDPKCKIVLLGDCASGKSCLFHRLATNQFVITGYTIGFNNEDLDWGLGVRRVQAQVYDTTGQDKCRRIVSMFLADTDIAICTIDLRGDNYTVWDNSVDYIIQCLTEALFDRRSVSRAPFSVIVVGTKLDECAPLDGEIPNAARDNFETKITRQDIEDDLIPKIKIVLYGELRRYLETLDPEMKLIDFQMAIPQFHMPLVWHHDVSSKTGENIESLRATIAVQIAHRLQFLSQS